MASHTKLQQKTLGTLRSILRHIRTNTDVVPSLPFVSDITTTLTTTTTTSTTNNNTNVKGYHHFTNYVLSHYRTYQHEHDKSKLKILRNQASDIHNYLMAVSTQQSLVTMYKGSDPDKPKQRDAAARYVGLEVPTTVPLGGKNTLHYINKYSEILKNKTINVDKFQGVDNIKAQYYGVTSVLEEKANNKEVVKAASIAGHNNNSSNNNNNIKQE